MAPFFMRLSFLHAGAAEKYLVVPPAGEQLRV